MAQRLNCWEFKKCGREPGGMKINELGVCPTATETFADGINGGKNGGRICWAIAGTLSNDIIQGTFAKNTFSCTNCSFFKLVAEGDNFYHFEMLMPHQLSQFLMNRAKKYQAIKNG